MTHGILKVKVPAPIRDDVKAALGAKEEEPADPDAGTGE